MPTEATSRDRVQEVLAELLRHEPFWALPLLGLGGFLALLGVANLLFGWFAVLLLVAGLLAAAGGGIATLAASKSSPVIAPLHLRPVGGAPAQPATAGPPPGWYPDPKVAGQLRRFNGVRWTDATRPIEQSSEPLGSAHDIASEAPATTTAEQPAAKATLAAARAAHPTGERDLPLRTYDEGDGGSRSEESPESDPFAGSEASQATKPQIEASPTNEPQAQASPTMEPQTSRTPPSPQTLETTAAEKLPEAFNRDPAEGTANRIATRTSPALEPRHAESVFCESCGMRLAATTRFCTACGARQPLDA